MLKHRIKDNIGTQLVNSCFYIFLLDDVIAIYIFQVLLSWVNVIEKPHCRSLKNSGFAQICSFLNFSKFCHMHDFEKNMFLVVN